ncbi:hypothetical protein NDN08_003919 [Rhodosorus marinus]|uniref:chorismate mutase n=1 Tax=Rhodosorus marinus TaxID=101924 RepID=A0AAV8UGU0_9RHOD|nr:hypothetical protein NDN08_003919 [Rhodosorus marinus]
MGYVSIPGGVLRGRRKLRLGSSCSRKHIVRCEVHREHREKYGIPTPVEGEPLRLDDLRENLVRQEETIIFAIVERAQFAMNDAVYDSDKLPVPGFNGCFSQYLLYELEKVYASVRRYKSPDEHPFCANLPSPTMPGVLEYPKTIIPNSVNVNDKIWDSYTQTILPQICEPGDDGNYGSSCTCDVTCLQAISKRIHYGKFIAESKFLEAPDIYSKHIRNEDRQAIWNELSNFKVEELLLKRIFNKASAYVQDITDDGALETYKIQPEALVRIYKDLIIPMTKEVEVDYLMVRI